jgi:2-phosphoglycerate kinase
MIYLIGGSPRCGKTKVAKVLASRTNIPWFPADYLGAVVSPYIPENEQAAKFPLRVIRDQNPSNDFRYSNYSSEEIVEFYYTQAKSVWLGLKAFIKYAAHDEQDFILEGYQITPTLLSELDEDIKKSVKSVFLYKQDEADIKSGFKKNLDPRDWLLNNTINEATFAKVANSVHVFGERTLREVIGLGMISFNMDGDFEKKVEEVVCYLTVAVK